MLAATVWDTGGTDRTGSMSLRQFSGLLEEIRSAVCLDIALQANQSPGSMFVRRLCDTGNGEFTPLMLFQIISLSLAAGALSGCSKSILEDSTASSLSRSCGLRLAILGFMEQMICFAGRIALKASEFMGWESKSIIGLAIASY